MNLSSLRALSPVDGRYADKVHNLRDVFSEYGLIRYRVLVEVRWLQWLADQPQIAELPPLTPLLKDVLNGLVDNFSSEDAERVKAIEVDVNCVEWLQRMKKDHGVKYGLGHTIRAALELYGCVAAARGSLRPLTTHCRNLRGWEKMPPPVVDEYLDAHGGLQRERHERRVAHRDLVDWLALCSRLERHGARVDGGGGLGRAWCVRDALAAAARAMRPTPSFRASSCAAH